jgi:hypothetical protein
LWRHFYTDNHQKDRAENGTGDYPIPGREEEEKEELISILFNYD